MFKVFKIIKNYFFCLRYPFYRMYDYKGKVIGYEFTWYDHIDIGWRKAFGKVFSKELKELLIRNYILKEFRFTDIKEKWGQLSIYSNFYINDLEKFFNKYETMSRKYCIECGEKATHTTEGYILPLCDECFQKYSRK